MMVAMALLHKAGMFSSLDESKCCSSSLAYVWVCLVCWGSVVDGLLVFRVGEHTFGRTSVSRDAF